VPYPIQSGSISDRLRKFFRIRGKTSFSLDEMVAPVVLVQDLTKGPYQAGVTPAAGAARLTAAPGPGPTDGWSFGVMLNDKPGSITPVLDLQFDERSFSFTWAQIENAGGFAVGELDELELKLTTRANVIAAGVPTDSQRLVSIQGSDKARDIPVEIFEWDFVSISGKLLWRGLLGDNTNTVGRTMIFEEIIPSITIGPEDVLVFTTRNVNAQTAGEIRMAVRGFYQEQPA